MSLENVILITIDSLRADYRRVDAPVLSELADEGTAFQRAFATGPGTTASFPGILTGTRPLSHDGLGRMSDDRPFLARELSERGLTTGGFHSNPFLSSTFDYDTGFDTFRDYQDSLTNIGTRLFPQGIEKSALPDMVTGAIKFALRWKSGQVRPYESAEVITDDAVDWLGETSGPFFEWVHYMDVHHPCSPPEEYLSEVGESDVSAGKVADLYSTAIESPDGITEAQQELLVNTYRASLRYVDGQFRRLVEALERQGRCKETLVIVTSDHGQVFGEWGAYGKPYRLTDDLIRVPLVLSNAPSVVYDEIDDLVSLVDIPPLIHDALGFDIPNEYHGVCPGRDDSREWVFAEHQVADEVLVGVRSSEQKYVVDGIADVERTYDVNDGEEQATIVDDVSADLRDLVLQRLEDVDVERPRYVAEVDTATKQRLDDLGYLR